MNPLQLNRSEGERKSSQTDIKELVESIFRIRTPTGKLIDYKVIPPHEILLRSGLLGDKSALFRIINKGRRGGFSTFSAVEDSMIAQYFPHVNIFYVATKEEQSKRWLRKVERIGKDSRLWPDGSRIIDIDSNKSSLLEKAFRHFPKEVQKEIEYSYITGLSASPSGSRGEGAIKVNLDEFAWMIQKINMQKEIYEAVSYFVAEGGCLNVQSTPTITTDLFWDLYTNAKRYQFVPYHFPIIENWKELDLHKPLYIEMDSLTPEQQKGVENSQRYTFYEEYINRPEGLVKVRIAVQKIESPYFWLTPKFLESKRAKDLDYFKQENLGIPNDTSFRALPPDLIYPNVTSTIKTIDDGEGMFIIAIDVAQVNDATVMTVGEQVDGIIHERWIEDSQDKYPIQLEILHDLCRRYRPIELRIDGTGAGRVFADMIEDDPGFPRLKRIVFNTYITLKEKKIPIKEFMFLEFKQAMVNKTYQLLDNHYAISQVLGMQAIDSGTTIKYTGKKSGVGRDDHFWSKAMLNANFDVNSMSEAFHTPPNRRSFRRIPTPNKPATKSLFPARKPQYLMW